MNLVCLELAKGAQSLLFSPVSQLANFADSMALW